MSVDLNFQELIAEYNCFALNPIFTSKIMDMLLYLLAAAAVLAFSFHCNAIFTFKEIIRYQKTNDTRRHANIRHVKNARSNIVDADVQKIWYVAVVDEPINNISNATRNDRTEGEHLQGTNSIAADESQRC